MNFQELLDPSASDLINNLQTPSWGMTNKLILVTSFSLLEDAPEPEELDLVHEQLRSLIMVLKNLSENIHVVFSLSDLDQRLKIFKEFKKEITTLELHNFKPFGPWDTKIASQWLIEMYNSLNSPLRLDPMIAEYFVGFVGTEDSSKLYSEMTRLNAMGKELTTELIDIECAAQHNVFGYVLSLATANYPKAFMQLRTMIQNKEAHPGTFAIIDTMLLKYLKIKLVQQAGLSKDARAELLGMTTGALYHKERESENISTARLESLLSALLKYERASKTGQMSPQTALQALTAQ